MRQHLESFTQFNTLPVLIGKAPDLEQRLARHQTNQRMGEQKFAVPLSLTGKGENLIIEIQPAWFGVVFIHGLPDPAGPDAGGRCEIEQQSLTLEKT